MLRGDDIIAVVHVRTNFASADVFKHQAVGERALVELRPRRRGHHQHLERHRPGLAQQLDLVEQPIVRARRIQRLRVVVHHHRHRADARVAHEAERFGRLVDALSLVDEGGGHVFHAQPQCAAAGLADEREVLLHHQRVVDGHFGVPAGHVAQRLAFELR